MRTSHTKLSNWFILKIYSPEPTTLSTSATQQSPIALVNSSQPHWNDAGLPTTLNSILWIFHERLEMARQVRFNSSISVQP